MKIRTKIHRPNLLPAVILALAPLLAPSISEAATSHRYGNDSLDAIFKAGHKDKVQARLQTGFAAEIAQMVKGDK